MGLCIHELSVYILCVVFTDMGTGVECVHGVCCHPILVPHRPHKHTECQSP